MSDEAAMQALRQIVEVLDNVDSNKSTCVADVARMMALDKIREIAEDVLEG